MSGLTLGLGLVSIGRTWGVHGGQPLVDSAAQELIVHPDLLQRQTGHFGDGRLCTREDLRSDPHIAAVLTDVHRAVHRLHRRMCKERHLVHRFDLQYRKRMPQTVVTEMIAERTFGEQLVGDDGADDAEIGIGGQR